MRRTLLFEIATQVPEQRMKNKYIANTSLSNTFDIELDAISVSQLA